MKRYFILGLSICFLSAGCNGNNTDTARNGYEWIYKVTGFCIKHQFAPADCLKAETCEICSITQGEALGHEWVDATCDTSKTCTRCYETEGEALGHSTKMGQCENCGEKQLELMPEFMEIYEYCMDANEYSTDGSSYLNEENCKTVSSIYYACSSASIYFSNAKESYQKAYDACGDYEEFIEIRRKLKTVIDSIPVTKPSNSKNSCATYLENARTYLYSAKDFYQYMGAFWAEVNADE